jgi:anti-anti-sigma factor
MTENALDYSAFSIFAYWRASDATVSICGDLDVTTAASLTAWVRSFTRRPCRRALLDLSGVEFADLAGARALEFTCSVLRASGTSVEVAGLPASTVRVMGLTGISRGHAAGGVRCPDGAGGAGGLSPVRVR